MTLLVLLNLAACSQPSQPNGSPGLNSASGASSPNQAAGAQWTIPPGWLIEPARPMRVGTYRIPAAPADLVDAECAVYFFGSGQGGTVEDNLRRWANEFPRPDGSTTADTAKQSTLVISGLNVHTISVSGTFMAASRPTEPGQKQEPDIRMLGAIVEAPQGLVFIKLTGPLNTVDSAEPAFNFMLNSLHKQ